MRRTLPVLAALMATSVAAEPVALDGPALTAMMNGASIRLDTPLGTTIPVHYGDNGQVWGEAGSVAFALGAPADRGRWWVDADRLCHRWTVWFDRETQCLRLRQDGTRLSWVRDDGKTGTATLVLRPQSPSAEPARLAQMTSPTPVSPPLQSASGNPRPASPAIRPAFAAANPPTPKPGPTQPAAAKLKPLPRTTIDQRADTAIGSAVPSNASPVAATLKAVSTQPPQRAPLLPTFKVAFVADDDVLNVRTGPAMEYASIGAIPPDAQGVRVTGVCEQDWCPIVHRNILGWVNRYYLEMEPFNSDPSFMHIRAAAKR